MKVFKILGWCFLLTAFTGCQVEDMPGEDNTNPVMVNLAFSVAKPTVNLTRMADAIVQADGQTYRGFYYQDIIPFSVTGRDIQKTDRPLGLFNIDGQVFDDDKDSPYAAFYRYNFYNILQGTASFLVYGNANDATNTTDKATYGSLLATFPADHTPAGISFKPEPIYGGTEPPTDAELLAKYLTKIANTAGWSQAANSWLRAVYLNFTGQEDEGNVVMAGSTTNVIAHVNALYKALSDKTFDAGSQEATLKESIMASIKTGYSEPSSGNSLTVTFNDTDQKVTALSVNYPANGLPDGAAALQWSKKEGETEWRFVPQTETTTLASINSINRYAYPAELYYYTNSTIRTSTEEVNTDANYNSKSSWDEIMDLYPNSDGVVTTSTKSAAIVKPLQYGVARLKVSLKAVATTLADNHGNSVNLSAKTDAFPVTGVIVCNQHPVGFDFKPKTYSDQESKAEDKFIYDTQILKDNSTQESYYLSTTEQTLPSTLVLQSYDDEQVTIILEFRNNSGVTFHGRDGLVHPGTKFYLIAAVKPEEVSQEGDGEGDQREDYEKRVFTQDYVTTVNMQVVSEENGLKSLANAYNVLPDVLGGRLEVGVMLTPDWIQATPTNTVLE